MLTFKTIRALKAGPRIACVALAGGVYLSATAQPVGSEEKGLGFGQSVFFSFRQAAEKIRPDFDLKIWATNLEKALVAYRAGEFLKAHNLFKAAADEGDLMAHWWLGRMYQMGQGVTLDDAQAFGHFRKAALAFDGREPPGPLMGAKLDSLVHVGRYYKKGVPDANIPRQPQRALRIFRTAAEFKHPGAQYGIGVMYYDGDGLEKRPRRGMRWLMLSAQKHFPLALAKLGDIYWSQRDKPFSDVRAMMWYILAQNVARPEIDPDIINRYNELASTLTPQVQEQARQMALSWSRRFPPPPHRQLTQPVAGTAAE
ncbi:MAG: tetratricopeptide repeat protein [Pseudomonadota bacterium]